MPKIPNKMLPYLKCRHCQGWISCGPVHVLPQGSSLCGRCESVAIKQYRHIAFEALAAHFQYPCMYYREHCPQLLRWNEAVTHEDECTYQSFCGKLCNHPGAICKGEKKIEAGEEPNYEYIPDFVLDRLRCSLCENYLSCTPIYVTEEGKSICHRCVPPTEPPAGAIRHHAFEILADATILPCMYRSRGCPQYFRFGRDMLNHEMGCSYGVVYRRAGKPRPKGKSKERGVIETHTGHVYGTITPNSLHLFQPQTPNVKENGKQGQYDFVDALRKQQEKFSNVQQTKQQENGNARDEATSIIRTPIVTPEIRSTGSTTPENLEPKRNGVVRNASMHSNANPELISELKMRQRVQKGSETGSDGGSSLNINSNLDDIFWVYDEVLNEYRNSTIVKKKIRNM